MKIAFLALLSFVSQASANVQAQSISDLPALAKLLVHHYDCRLALLPASGPAKELNFQISPNVSGHDSLDFPLAQGADKVVASASAQALQIVWTRNNQTIASAQAWVQNSTTQAFVLMVSDPKDDATQTHLSCNAVMFADVKGGTK